MKPSIIACWMFVNFHHVKADEDFDYVKNCIDHPDNDNGEELDEFPLIDGSYNDIMKISDHEKSIKCQMTLSIGR